MYVNGKYNPIETKVAGEVGIYSEKQWQCKRQKKKKVLLCKRQLERQLFRQLLASKHILRFHDVLLLKHEINT